jgi:hypothetical protein
LPQSSTTPASTSRILPPIHEGTPQPDAPASLPGGVRWDTVPGNLAIASGWLAIGILSQRGRTPRLRRMAERTARNGGGRW